MYATISTESSVHVLYAILSVAAGIIASKSVVPPNPRPAHAEAKDALFEKRMLGLCSLSTALGFYKYLFLLSGILAAILCLDQPLVRTASPPHPSRLGTISQAICPYHVNLSPTYITPTPYSLGLATLAILSGLLRLEAYRQLGANFTFQLAKPSRLNTAGLYAYVQHPSYTGGTVMMISLYFLWFQPQSLTSCYLPTPLTTFLSSHAPLRWTRTILLFALGARAMRTRVRQEEAMMKRAFGRDWEAWSARTPRFVPGLL